MAAYLLYAVARFVQVSLDWPLVGDATLLHYCVLMMRHGYAPYRQLIDVNLPGTYFVEWAVTGLFGYGALAWRLFDLTLLATLAATAWRLLDGADGENNQTRLQHRLNLAWGTIWAAGLFTLLHGRDGIEQLGQRDLLMTALLSVAAALLVGTRRRARPALALAALAGCGVCIGAAAAVKPLALLLLPAWLACLYARRRRGTLPFAVPTLAALAGAMLPLAASLLWLVHAHALGAFLGTVRDLVPLHASLFRLSAGRLLGGTVSSVLLPVFLLGLAPVLAAKPWRSFSGSVLLLGFAFGALSFWAQGRGYPYHRYPSEWFLLLLWAWAWPRARRQGALLRTCAFAALAWGVLIVAPRSLSAVRGFTPQIDTQGVALRTALEREGGAQLNRQLQCLDMAGGCVTTLLRMDLVQSTGYLYDCYAMAPVAPRFLAEQQRYRAGWMRALEAHPPQVFIAFSDECGPPDERYTLLTRWPALASLLQDSYRLDEQWIPTETERWSGKPVLPYGFRIYRRKR